jgi:hypothetical protein
MRNRTFSSSSKCLDLLVLLMMSTDNAPGAGLWLSCDNGRTWEPFDDLPFSNIQHVTFDPSDDALMYVTTFGGVWRGLVVPGE